MQEQRETVFESESGARYVRDSSGNLSRVREERPHEQSPSPVAIAGAAIATVGFIAAAPAALLAGGVMVLGSLLRKR